MKQDTHKYECGGFALCITRIVAILFFISLFLFFAPSVHAAAPATNWWNSNYLYRQKITVAAAGGSRVPKDYNILTTIDTGALQTAGKVRSDRKDWHIVYWDEGSGTWVDLSRDYQSTTATYFRAQRDIAQGQSDDNYYAYYGYSSESTNPPSAIDDEFSATTLDSSWTWSTPVAGPTYSLTANPGFFRLTVPNSATYDWWSSIDQAPKLSKAITAYDWTVTTKVTLATYTGSASYRTGIVLYDSSSTESNSNCTFGFTGAADLNLECLGNAAANITYGNTTVYLRIRKSGTTYNYDYSSDNSTWTNAGSFVKTFTTPVVGFFSKTFSSPSTLSTDFDYFRVTYFSITTAPTVTTSSERQNGNSSSVSAANSVVSATPVWATTNYPSNIYITLKDQYGDGVANKTVTLSSTRSDFVVQPSAVTDTYGRTFGAIYAQSTGSSTITATDTTDSTTISQTAAITFANKEPTGYNAFNDLDNLIYLRNGVYAKEVSSYDRTGNNTDGGVDNSTGTASYLSKDGTNYVVLDEKSPGCVYDFWAANPPAGNVQFYFNGESTPSVNLATGTFWGGSSSPFMSPITAGTSIYEGANNSLFPMCYSKSLKIEFTQFPGYYHIIYHTFADSSNVTDFNLSDSSTTLLNLFNGAGSDPKQVNDDYIASGSSTVNAGTAVTLSNLSLAGVINSLKLTFSAYDATTLRSTYVKIYFDGENSPSVNAPAAYFFGSGLAETSTTSMMVGMSTVTHQYYSYWPMPFNTSAKVVIDNQSATNLTINYDIAYRNITSGLVGTSAGYFKAFYNTETPTTTGKDYTILNTTGSGHYVGAVVSIEGATDNNQLEGNEHIYVDNSLTAQFLGTGTEDYFLGGFYFNTFTTFSQAIDGLTTGTAAPSLTMSAYRLHLTDLIPFQKSIIVGLEHGQTNNLNANYKSVAFYYDSGNQLAQSDTLDVNNTTSETNHSYTISGQTGTISSTSHDYEASTISTLTSGAGISDDGKSFNGYSQFVATINPLNDGVRLRRRFDQNTGNQQAQVYVNGSLVGTWYSPGRNSSQRWKDSDFDIPASFTAGKSSVTIKISFVSSDSDWNEFYYWIYSFTNGISPYMGTPTATPTSSGSTVTWNTNILSSSIVDYGLTSGTYTSSTSEIDTTGGVTSHSVSVSGLNACTLYHYRVRSDSQTGNMGTGTDQTFTTSGCSSGSSQTVSSSGSTASSCSDASPGGKLPTIYGAIAQNDTSIEIYFTPADQPVTNYVLEYGTASGNYKYGIQNMGVNSQGQMTYLVGNLNSNTTYYFRVRASNGCATGGWSNEAKATTTGGNKIAQPSSIPTPTSTQPTSHAGTQVQLTSPSSYDVNVKVLDTNNQPVVGAKVTLHSIPRTAFTNSQGIADFQNVEAGKHEVLIASSGYSGQQSITLSGNVSTFDLNVHVQRDNVMSSPLFLATITGLGAIIVGLIIIVFWQRNKK